MTEPEKGIEEVIRGLHLCELDEKRVRNLLHQELQKARQDWLQEEIVKLEGMKWKFVPGFNEADVAIEIKTGAYRYIGQGAKDACDAHNKTLDQAITLVKEVLQGK